MKYAAVIVDTRPINYNIVYNHVKHLPDDWDVVLFMQPNSLDTKRKLNARGIVIPCIKNSHDYNKLMTSISFWEYLEEYDRVLIFQQDSMLLRSGIEEFLKWDYVGAPWFDGAPWQHPKRKGGNGGLSLRNPKNTLTLLRSKPYNPSMGNEDVYYSHNLQNVAPLEVCERFSCETVYKLGTLGYHAIQKYLSSEEVNNIINQYGD